jgi:hypothetical protein
MSRRRVILIVGLLLVLFASVSMLAQSFEATVVGTVTDPSGAAVVGATVTITEDASGLERTTTTNGDGSYSLLQLRPSTYTIKFESAGFRTYQKKSLVLETNQTLRVDVGLKVGAVTDTVTVTAEATTINTENAKKGETIVNTQVEGLPLNGRDFQDLAMLVPGVYPKPSDDDQGNGYATSGTRTDSTNFTLDGVNNRSDRTGGVGVNTSVDSIQEFNVSTSSYSAEYGRQAGAQVTVVSKAGTNNLHGSLFDYLRSDIIDAQNYQGGASSLRRQQFGGTLGGKIVKDRSFFFGSYEGSRMAQSETAEVNAPNADWLGRGASGMIGDFRDLLDPSSTSAKPVCSAAATVYGQTGPHQCQVGYNVGSGTSSFRLFSQNGGIDNVIPVSMLSPTSLAMLQYIPSANAPGGLESYIGDGLHYTNTNKFLAKIDQTLSSKNSMYLRWARQSGTQYDPFPSSRNYYPHMGTYARTRSDSIALGDTATINNTTVNEFRFGWYNQSNGTFGQDQNLDYAAMFGIPGVSQGSYWQGFPAVRIDGYPEMGDRPNSPYVYQFKNFQAANTLTMVRGKNTFKFGADIARNNYIELGDTYMRGDFRFRGKNSSYGAINAPDPWAFADFLMGLPDSSQRQVGNTPSNLVGWPMGFFGQDDWKILPSLTLNLGLRYDLFLPFTEKNGNLANFIPSTGQLVVAGDPAYPKGLEFTNWRNIEPRVGFAWRPFKTGSAVIRGGGGIFYSQEMYNVVRQQLAQNYVPSDPFMDWQLYSRVSSSPCQLQMGTPSAYCAAQGTASNWPASLMSRNVYGMDPHGRTPQVYQYNLTVEQEVARDLTWEIGYVGSLGRFLGHRYDANQGRNPTWSCSQSTDPSTGLPTVSCKAAYGYYPFPDLVKGSGSSQSVIYQSQDAKSNYNALQTSLRRRSKGGLTLLVSYTFSRMIDSASSTNTSTTGAQKYPQNSQNMAAERGLSDVNRTHQFTTALNYQLPIGRGKWLFSNAKGWTNALAGNWQLNMKGSVLSGRPFTPMYNAGDFTSERPNEVSDPYTAGAVLANPDPTCHYLQGQTGPDGTQGRAPATLGGASGMAFNPCAFARPSLQAAQQWAQNGYQLLAQPTMPVYGTLGRNTLIGPAYFDLDMGISKNFKFRRISDKASMQLRFESFNVLNHPNFQIPNYLLDQPNVAEYRTMAGDNRVFQFAVKLLF